MILLIDGYNVLKQVFHKKTIDEHERVAFAKQLGKYAKHKGHKIVLVFDGGPFDFTTKDRVFGVYLVYAGTQETADDYIKRYLEEHKSLDILLVSSDLDIRNFAGKRNIESIESPVFYTIFKDSVKGMSPEQIKADKEKAARKIAEGNEEEFDEIMQKASKVVEVKSEDFLGQHEIRNSSSQKISKKEKKRLKQIKKL